MPRGAQGSRQRATVHEHWTERRMPSRGNENERFEHVLNAAEMKYGNENEKFEGEGGYTREKFDLNSDGAQTAISGGLSPLPSGE